MDDLELLKAYVDDRDQDAFAQLVGRHGGWLYAAARRQLRDGHLAEDVTQAVFLLLSRRAGRLRGYRRLSGWLFVTLGFCVKQARGKEAAVKRREQEAASMRPEVVQEASWDDVAPLLETVVGKLGKADRDAVLLRFYEQKPLAEVGRLMGTSEEAARKRVDRAVGKLRGMLERQGVTGTSAGLSAVLVGNVVQEAPNTLLDGVMRAVGGGNAGAGGIAQGAAKVMALAKVKVALAFGAALLAGSVAGGITLAAMPATAKTATPPATHRAKLVLADMARATSIHALTKYGATQGGERPQIDETWFVPGKGIAIIGHYPNAAVVHMDNGVNCWRYRVGGKVVGRSASEQTVEKRLEKLGARLAVLTDLGPMRRSEGDRVVGTERLRCYDMTQTGDDQIARIWIDDANRLRGYQRSAADDSEAEIGYEDVPSAAVFSTTWPKDAEVLDSDSYLAERYPVEKALFVKEAAGVVFAVHECKVDEQGCCHVICSTRVTKDVGKELGLSGGFLGNAMLDKFLRAEIVNGEARSLGYVPQQVANFRSGYGWVEVGWYVLVPDPAAPEMHGPPSFAVRVATANELATLRKGKGLTTSEEFAVRLDRTAATNATVDDFARRVWKEADHLWPAVDGTLWLDAQSQGGKGVVMQPRRPGAVDQGQFVANLQRRVERCLLEQ